MDNLNVPIDDLEMVRQVSSVKDRLVMNYVMESRSLTEALIGKTVQLAQKNQSITRLFLSTIESLAATLETRDQYTEGHSRRVAFMATATGRCLGWNEEEQKHLEIAGLLHDLGKIGIPDIILNKPGPLTEEEFARMKEHPQIAAQILAKIEGLEEVALWVRHHHERIDGRGYPDGLKGKLIPLGARILTVADAYDAMVSHRPYRKALPIEIALSELKTGRGAQFDEKVVDGFLTALQETNYFLDLFN